MLVAYLSQRRLLIFRSVLELQHVILIVVRYKKLQGVVTVYKTHKGFTE